MATWVIDIENEYEFYDPFEYKLKLEKKCIYKWPSDLAMTSSMSMHRTPHMASLGPYHSGEEPLQPMEHQKKRALFRILKRCGVPITRFVHSLQDIEQELRDRYDNLDPELPSDSFLRMMLIDGCFILELLRSRSTENSNWFDPSEPIFSRMGKLTLTVGFRDMLLLENQIPLLVLKKLLEVESGTEIDDRYLNRLICTFFGFGSLQIDGPSLHILDIRRKCLIMAMPTIEQTTPSVGFIKSVCLQCRRLIPMHVIEKGIKYIIVGIPILFFRILSKQISKQGNMRSALRFHEAGIEFKRAKPGSGLKITFDEEHGVLTLPIVNIDDNTAAIYMNLMAFERMHPKLTENNAVTSYVSFMDSLIDTAEDVSLLCSQGIMKNFLGSDEDAANVFNKLGDGIMNCLDDELDKQLQSYVASDWNAARAYLKRNYFHNPWSILSLLAAIILLVLTFIQTVFSVLAVQNGK